jgi:hypothetical protein
VGVAQAVECLLCKWEALSSNSNPAKNITKQRKKREENNLGDKTNIKIKFGKGNEIITPGI